MSLGDVISSTAPPPANATPPAPGTGTGGGTGSTGSTAASPVHVGGAAPASPKSGDLWLENTVMPPVLHVYDGSNWRSITSDVAGSKMIFKGSWSTHGGPPTTALKGDIYTARDDANPGGLDATWGTNGRGKMAKTNDLLLCDTPDWHVIASR